MRQLYLTKLLIVTTILFVCNQQADAQTTTYNAAGAYVYTVPQGVNAVSVDMAGAKGGDGYGGHAGGKGGRLQCTIAVTPGQILNVFVGGAGTTATGCCVTFSGGVQGGGGGQGGNSGYFGYGAGGGASSDIRIGGVALSNRVAVAAGGGGGADWCGTETGGDGGGSTGGNGSYCGGTSSCCMGFGATASAGGAGATYGGTTGGPGAGGGAGYEGGGGGGGYYGGGGGYYGSGGGGSSFPATGATAGPVSNVTNTGGYQSGNGYVSICAPNVGFVVANIPVCSGANNTLIATAPGGVWTSGTTSIATVGSSSGVVTGVSAGSAIVTYSVNITGCGSGFVTIPVTVNASPAAISGTPSACPGTTTTLSDAGGGAWTSSNPLVATVGSGSGVVTGNVPGTTNITYTLPVTGCTSTVPVVINPLPSGIAGTTTACAAGGTTLLSSSSPGGFWSSGNSTVATVSGTGLVSGVAAGGTTITYTLPTGCIATTNISINPLPSAITGPTNVCVGNAITLNDVGGGTWSSGNVAVASAVPLTGSISGVSAGTVMISYTLPTGCSTTTSVLVNPLPNPITGTASACEGDNTTLSDASGGGVWSSGNLSILSVVPTTGTVSGLSSGTASVSYTLTTGCAATKIVTVNPLPTAFTISGGGGYCSGGTGVHVGLSFANAGVNYKLYNGTSLVATVGGSNAGLDFGVQSAVGTYSVIGVNSTTGCTNPMSGTTTISINPLPNVYTTSGGGTFCPGGAGAHVSLSGSDAGINYQLYVGGVATGTSVTGTGTALDFGAQMLAGSYTVVAANTTTGCSMNMTGSASIALNALPTVYSLNSGGGYCIGGTGVDLVLNGSSVGVNYQLYNNGTATGSAMPGTGSTLHFGLHTTPGTYTVVATNATTLCANNMAGSAVITVNPLPNVYSVTGGGSYCAGGAGAHVTLSYSDAGINYQLFRGSSPVGGAIPGSNAGLDFGMQTALGTYSVIATDPISGCTRSMTGTAAVSTSPLPNTYTVTGGGTYCVGGTGRHVMLSGSNTGIQYQLMYAGNPSGAAMMGTGGVLDFGLQTAAGSYTVVATNITTSCTNNMLGSASITVNSLPNAYVVTGLGTSYCAGSGGIDVMLSGSDFGVNYQLYRGATPVGAPWTGSGSSIDFGSQVGSGNYTVVATDAGSGCTGSMTGSAPITQYPLPTAFRVTGGGNYCSGAAGVHIGLSGSTVGVDYQLANTGGNVGGPMGGIGSGLDFGLNTVADVYTVTATDAVTGCTNTMTGSATIVINPLPAQYAVTGGGNYCLGTAGVPVGLANSDLGIMYQLMNGTATVGGAMTGSGSAIDFSSHTAGNYTVMATDPLTTCSNIMTGNAVVGTNPLPTSQTVTGGGTFCSGGAGVDVALSNSDPGVNYQLYYGVTAGPILSGTGSSLDFGMQTGAGTYNVVATDSTTLCHSNMTGTAVVTILPTPAVQTVTGGGGYCVGGTGVAVGLGSSESAIVYQLYLFGSPVGSPVTGTGSPINFGTQTAAGLYTVVASPGGICMTNMGGSATVTVNQLPNNTYAVTNGGSYCSGGTGVHVGLSNSDAGISYQLYRGTTATGGTMAGSGSSIDFGLQTAAGTYTVIATDSATGCSSSETGSVSVRVTPGPTAFNVGGGGAYCTGGSGVHVTLSGSVTNVNYQLYHASTMVGTAMAGTGTILDFGPQAGVGQYTIVATDAATGCTNNMADTAIVSVNPILTPAFSIAGQTVIKKQQRDTLSVAALTNGGTGTKYQWSIGGFPVTGATNATYVSSNFASGDVVACSVTSGDPCGGVVVTHSVTMTVNSATGVQQVTAGSSNVNVIPNPNKGTFTLTGSLGTSEDQEVSIDLTDIVGHTIYSSKFTAKNGDVNEKVSVGNIANGMYILSMRSETENKVFHVVIEQ